MGEQPGGWPAAVVFDFDGTLVDSIADIAAALNAALALHGLPPLPVDRVRQMVGGGIPKLVERALLAHGVSRDRLMPLAGDFLRIYRERLVVDSRLFEGGREMLDLLKAEGIKLGICTNKQQELTVEALALLGIGDYFSAIVGESIGKPKKPDPAPLQAALTTLGVPPEEAVMVGDSAADVGCARAAGVPCIVVSYGYTRRPPHDLGGDLVIDSLSELPDALLRLRAAQAAQ